MHPKSSCIGHLHGWCGKSCQRNIENFLQMPFRMQKNRCITSAWRFLPGRSLKNNLYNLNLSEAFSQALISLGGDLDSLYRHEPDAGLGIRLAWDGLQPVIWMVMATKRFVGAGATPFSMNSEFSSKKLPTDGKPSSRITGCRRRSMADPPRNRQQRFVGGAVRDSGKTVCTASNTPVIPRLRRFRTTFLSPATTRRGRFLRLYKAQSPGVDMEKIQRGDYLGAFGATALAETHIQGALSQRQPP